MGERWLEVVDASGTLAKVTLVGTNGRTVFARYMNGSVIRITSDSRINLETDAVILVSEDGSWRVVPDDLWHEPTSIGVIRKALDDDRWVIEAGSGLVTTERMGLTAAQVGNTVLFSVASGVIEIIDGAPMRIRLRDDDDGEDVSRFELTVVRGSLRYADFGGYAAVVGRARHIIETQFRHSEEMKAIGARPVRGVLLSGAPGTGKTYLAKVIAAESDAAFFQVSGPSIVSKYVGDSEDLLRRIFQAAQQRPRAIIFFDEIDSIAGERSEGSHEASDRLVAQLLTEMDGISGSLGNVIVLAATNRADSIDPALRRPGRFDWEIAFSLPTPDDRLAILEVDAKRLSTSQELPIEEIADLTNGWSAAELAAIWTEAALLTASEGRAAIDAEDLLTAFELIAKSRRGRDL